MKLIVFGLGTLLFASLLLNLYFYRWKLKGKRNISYDARKLLHALLDDPAILKIDVIDKSSILLRSPREME